MKIEWVHPSFFITKQRMDEKMEMAKAVGVKLSPPVPVVRVEALEALIDQAIPDNWCDPLLTGNQAALPTDPTKITCAHIEVLLDRLKARLLANLKEQP